MENNRRHFITVGILIALATPLVYWVLDTVLALPIQAVEEAIAIDFLFDMHIWLIAFLFSLVLVFMLYTLVVFRQRPGEEDREGDYFHSNTRLEIIWTVVPLIFVVVFGAMGTSILRDITQPKDNEMVVDVVAFQWGWSFGYPETGVQSGEMVLPVDQPVLLSMTSNDVLHNFWVPEFRVKQDTVPGRYTYLRFTPTVEGTYRILCAELCGLSHAVMVANVRVVSEQEFTAWMGEQAGVAALSGE